MNNPCLLDGLKFDIRLYVLVLSCDPLRIFIHKEGLVRFATKEYHAIDLGAPKSDLKQTYMHLTNYALNKDNADFIQATSVEDDSSHKRTITQLWRKLREKNVDIDKIQLKINDIIIKTMISVQ